MGIMDSYRHSGYGYNSKLAKGISVCMGVSGGVGDSYGHNGFL
jgi:hypothetical protein